MQLYREDDGRLSWVLSVRVPLWLANLLPVRRVPGMMLRGWPWPRPNVWTWLYGRCYLEPGFDQEVWAWWPLVPFIKAGRWVREWYWLREFVVIEWYLGLMGVQGWAMEARAYTELRAWALYGAPEWAFEGPTLEKMRAVWDTMK